MDESPAFLLPLPWLLHLAEAAPATPVAVRRALSEAAETLRAAHGSAADGGAAAGDARPPRRLFVVSPGHAHVEGSGWQPACAATQRADAQEAHRLLEERASELVRPCVLGAPSACGFACARDCSRARTHPRATMPAP